MALSSPLLWTCFDLRALPPEHPVHKLDMLAITTQLNRCYDHPITVNVKFDTRIMKPDLASEIPSRIRSSPSPVVSLTMDMNDIPLCFMVPFIYSFTQVRGLYRFAREAYPGMYATPVSLQLNSPTNSLSMDSRGTFLGQALEFRETRPLTTQL